MPTLQEIGVDYKLSVRSQQLAALSDAQFTDHLANWRKSAERESARVTTRILRRDDKRAARAEREQALAGRQLALPQRKFGVILADPEWQFQAWSNETGGDRSPDNHYVTSATDLIASRDVPSIAADDAALFLWGIVPMLPDALRVMAAWGFTYRSMLVWRKLYPGRRLGLGHWFRINHEVLLLGTRGRIPAPAKGDQWPATVVDAAWSRKHSEKPAIFHEIIESYFPTLPKIELNARAARPGWEVWGFDAPSPVSTEGGQHGE